MGLESAISLELFQQDAKAKYILNALASNQPGQSWLISGADIEYLESFVRGWIQVLVCVDRKGDQVCGICEGCKRFNLGVYSFHELKPMSLSRSILIDQVRGFMSKFSYKPSPWEWKIGIILEAECMVEQAQNAFLKTLEEPPPQTVFFLISNKPDALLNTIRSRCRVLSLNHNEEKYSNKPWWPALREVLEIMRPGSGIENAWQASQQLMAVIEQLRAQAELEVMDQVEDLESETAAQRKKRLEAAVKTRSLELRNDLINAMERWFGDMVKLAQGVDFDPLFDCSWSDDLDLNRAFLNFEFFQSFKQSLRSAMGFNESIVNFSSKVCKV